jgi:hypothetical protein
MLIVGIVAVVVVVAAAAGAIMLLGGGDADDNGDNDNKNGSTYKMKNGDFIEYRITNEDEYGTEVMNYRWDVSNVTSAGYDVLLTFTMSGTTMTFDDHYNSTDNPMFGAYNMYVTDDWLGTYHPGITVKDTTINTPLGSKAVKHYQVTIEDEDDASLVDHVDFYVGKSNGVLYKWVTVEKENGVTLATTTFEIFDSNIAMIGSNVDNDDDDGKNYLDYNLAVGDYLTYAGTIVTSSDYDDDYTIEGPSLRWEVTAVSSSEIKVSATEEGDFGPNSINYYPKHPVIAGAYWSSLHTLAQDYLKDAVDEGSDEVMIGETVYDVTHWQKSFTRSSEDFLETTTYDFYVGQVNGVSVLYQVAVDITTVDSGYTTSETTTFTLSETNVDGVL